jgi:uncharacterized repeat protein (TIGR01451 family)
MNKPLQAFLFFLIISSKLFAQTIPTGHHEPKELKLWSKNLAGEKIHQFNQTTSKNSNEVILQEEIIGTTVYDLQSYATSGNHIYYSNNHIGAVWNEGYLPPFYPFIETGYRYYDGSNWQPVINSTIDTISWSNIDLGFGDMEYIIGDNFATPSDLILLKRSPSGSGQWNKSFLPPHPSGNSCSWSKMRIGGANGATIHVLALTKPIAEGGTLLNGIDGALTYSRSPDGGATWNQVHIQLPMVDQQHYASMTPDSYTIDVINNTVAIVQGSKYNDWVLWKSTDNGTNWSRTVIMNFPIPAYDPNTGFTDVNSDAIIDTIDHIDGALSVLIDNSNLVHCWSGRLRVSQNVGTPMENFVTDGLLYWNENFAGSPAVIASAEDIDGSGFIELPSGAQPYPLSLTSMPSAGLDGSSNIFVAYSGIIENTTNGSANPNEEQAYRNIYVLMSPDNGASWSLPVRIEPSDFDECVFPSLARNTGPDLHLIYMKDGEPGTSINGNDPNGTNEIIYSKSDPQQLFPGITVVPNGLFGVKGKVYYDQNQNGIEDGGDYPLMLFPVSLMPNNQLSQSDNSGNYAFITDSGTKVVSIVNNGLWSITSDSATYTISLDSVVTDNLDFGLFPVSLVYDVAATLTATTAECDSYINYWITFHNVGTVATSGTVQFVKANATSYYASTPAYNAASADTFTWNFNNLLPFEQRTVIITLTSYGIPMGDTIYNCAMVNYDNGGSGGISQDCIMQTILCSLDPNDKTVRPAGVGLPHYALLTDTLRYTIRLQNTGTDTAFTVRVRDTLDSFIDPSSFRLIASSHPVTVTQNPVNVLLFEFQNILLPDSNVNLIGSNGFVKYSVMPLAGIPIGTEINNTAHIFFDFNAAVVTNTTTNTLVDILGTGEHIADGSAIHAYPNPFSNKTTIVFGEALTTEHAILLSDPAGRIIFQKKNITGTEYTLDAAELSSGLYFCILEDNDGKIKAVEKLIIK